MNRRHFLQCMAAAAVATRYDAAQSANASLTIGAASSKAIADDFIGLSYEAAQLANPAYFSADNKPLVTLFRELAPKGNLRIGGGSSEFTTYSDDAPSGPPPFEVFGPDTSKTVKSGTVTSAQAIRNLRGFLNATEWNCLYGLNLGQGSVENAVREAAAVHKILGPRLVAFQIGNEPDSFRNRYRPATYTPADYMVEWNKFHDAIVKTIPEARFAGPDISNKLPYLTAFAEAAPQHSDVILLTSHYYAMGPAGNPQATLDNLLDPDPKLTTLKNRDLHIIKEAQEIAHLPYRMSEGNSCWNGGQTGVSDVFGSALWSANYLLACMKRGWVGVNMHGGGEGFYAPIVGSPSKRFTRRPEFFGMRFAQRFVGAKVVEAEIADAGPRVEAFVFERAGKRELVLINKTPAQVTCDLPARMTAAPILRLHGPAIDAKEGTELTSVKGGFQHTTVAPAYTANVYELKGK